jgi:hypothetical protein
MATALYQVKDIVRGHLENTAFPTPYLDLALSGGRREVEKAGNFWWMKATKTFTATTDTNTYAITTAGTNKLNLPNFKDIRRLFWKTTTSTAWAEAYTGDSSIDELELAYATDSTGAPEAAAVDNTDLVLFPTPDQAYSMKMFHWEWTSNPASNLATDDLVGFFPEALIYGSLVWAYEIRLKDFEGASYWRTLLKGEIVKVRYENFKRGWRDKVQIAAKRGPGGPGRRRLDNVQLYGRW